MAYFPNGNRPYPAYYAGYPSNPMTTPWPTATPTNQNPFARPNPYTQQPARFPALNTYPQAPANTTSHWYSSAANNNTPQSMVISLNAPKLSAAEVKKNFWMKVAATTTSIVAGLGIAAYFGMKILPKKIAQEIGGEFKEALLSAEARETLLKEMAKTPEGQKALNGKKLADLSPKEKSKLLAEHNKSLPLSRVFALCTRESLDYTFTPEYTQKLLKQMQLEDHIKHLFNTVTSDEKFMKKTGDTVTQHFVDAAVNRFDSQVLDNDQYMSNAAKRVGKFMGPQVRELVDDLASDPPEKLPIALHKIYSDFYNSRNFVTRNLLPAPQKMT